MDRDVAVRRPESLGWCVWVRRRREDELGVGVGVVDTKPKPKGGEVGSCRSGTRAKRRWSLRQMNLRHAYIVIDIQ